MEAENSFETSVSLDQSTRRHNAKFSVILWSLFYLITIGYRFLSARSPYTILPTRHVREGTTT
jgi:hypothetical protein